MNKVLFGIFSVVEFMGALSAHAQSPFDQATKELDTAGGKAFGTTGTPNLPATIGAILQVFLGILGIVLVMIIVRGGIIYMNAGGDPSEVKKAKDYLKNGIIGFVIVVLAYALTSYVVSSLAGALAKSG